MSQIPPAPGAPITPQKKGLPVLAWVGIGCGALFLIVCLVTVAGTIFVAKKVKDKVEDVAADLEENPGLFAAKAIALGNPDIEIESHDETTVTFFNEKTEERFVVDWEDIEEGRFSLTSSEGSISIAADGADGEGQLTITGQDGEQKFRVNGTGSSVPDWIPLPSASVTQGVYSAERNGKRTGGFSAKSESSVEDIVSFYRGEFERGGYTIKAEQSFTQASTQTNILSAEHETNGRKLNVIVTQDKNGGVTLGMTFEE